MFKQIEYALLAQLDRALVYGTCSPCCVSCSFCLSTKAHLFAQRLRSPQIAICGVPEKPLVPFIANGKYTINFICAVSSIGQSVGLRNQRLGIRAPYGAPKRVLLILQGPFFLPLWFLCRLIRLFDNRYALLAQLDRALVYGTCSPCCVFLLVLPVGKSYALCTAAPLPTNAYLRGPLPLRQGFELLTARQISLVYAKQDFFFRVFKSGFAIFETF